MPKRRISAKKKHSLIEGKKEADDIGNDIVILFADIIGCSEISNHKTLKQYNDIISEFHSIFIDTANIYMNARYNEQEFKYFKYDVRGDEGNLMIFVPRKENYADDVDIVINFALEIKRKWLLSTHNKERIENKLLPTDLAIGIHFGKAYINQDSDENLRPEGYSINLAKRIEGASRDGKFTHIYVSEAARGELYLLTDEFTYTFAPPCTISPKGISKDIQVFELKHHFLPTDWTEGLDLPSGRPRSKIILFTPLEKDAEKICKKTHQLIPTNLWIAEEYIILKLICENKKLREKKLDENPDKLKSAYKDALDVSMRMSTGDQRDAVIVSITGLIEGEYKNYSAEQKLYNEAMDLDMQFMEAHWYLAYSRSMELYDMMQNKEKKLKEKVNYEEIFKDNKSIIDEILEEYKEAIHLNPKHSWARFDYAAELARWSICNKEWRKMAVDELVHACELNNDISYFIKSEPYLEPILDDRQVDIILKRTEKS